MQVDVYFSKGRKKKNLKREGRISVKMKTTREQSENEFSSTENSGERILFESTRDTSKKKVHHTEKPFIPNRRTKPRGSPPIAGNCLGPARFLRYSRDRYTQRSRVASDVSKIDLQPCHRRSMNPRHSSN